VSLVYVVLVPLVSMVSCKCVLKSQVYEPAKVAPPVEPKKPTVLDCLFKDPRDPTRKLTYAESRALYG
jgi:hypothetical protein